MLYVRELEQAKYSQGGLPDRQRLTAARQDLDKVLTVRPCLRTHLELAQVKMQVNSEWHFHQGIQSCASPSGVLLHGRRCAPGEPFGG